MEKKSLIILLLLLVPFFSLLIISAMNSPQYTSWNSIKRCPTYSPPECEGILIPGEIDENGCPGPLTCGECPTYSPPECRRGIIISGEVDENGCMGPLKCIKNRNRFFWWRR